MSSLDSTKKIIKRSVISHKMAIYFTYLRSRWTHEANTLELWFRIILSMFLIGTAYYFLNTMTERLPRLAGISFILCSLMLIVKENLISTESIKAKVLKYSKSTLVHAFVALICATTIFIGGYCLPAIPQFGIALFICGLMAYQRYPAHIPLWTIIKSILSFLAWLFFTPIRLLIPSRAR
jgi:hypothetical protein